MAPILPELTSKDRRPRASWRSVLVQTVLALTIWYGAMRGASAVLGQRHMVVYMLLFALFPLVILLGVRLVRSIMSSILNPDV